MIPRRKPFFAPKSFVKSLSLLILGERTSEVLKLERELEKKMKLPNPVVVASGRLGLQLILEESGIKKGSEIIIPGYTFGLLTSYISASGFKPRPVDIDPDTFQMSPEAVSKAVGKRTGAILATHIFGEPCDIKSISKIATKHRLILIEDCAESMGASIGKRMLGTFSDVGISSFNIAKPLQGITGGVVFGKNRVIIKKIRGRVSGEKPGQNSWKEILRAIAGYYLTQTPLWYFLMFIFSFRNIQKRFVSTYRKGEVVKTSPRLPEVYALITRMNLKSLRSRIIKRRHIRNVYHKLLGKVIKFQKMEKGSLGNAYMVVGTINGDVYKIRRHLALRGVDIAIRDEIADDCLQKRHTNVEKVHKSAIALPIYEELTTAQIKSVCKLITGHLRQTPQLKHYIL